MLLGNMHVKMLIQIARATENDLEYHIRISVQIGNNLS